MAVRQISLWCGCGAPGILCITCLRRAYLSRRFFAGEREAVLKRDDYQCRTCGEIKPELLLVHHRTPGSRSRRRMVTICRACHNTIHHTHRPSAAMAREKPFLYLLWREHHLAQAEQLLFALLAPSPPVQPTLFPMPAKHPEVYLPRYEEPPILLASISTETGPLNFVYDSAAHKLFCENIIQQPPQAVGPRLLNLHDAADYVQRVWGQQQHWQLRWQQSPQGL